MNVEPVHKTRAQVLRDKVVIRLALDEAGPKILEIIEANGVRLPYADFSKVFPHWLIATVDDEVIGCVMVLPAKPFGFVEFLLVKPWAPFKLRAIAIRKLCLQAAGTLQVYGSSYLWCTVNSNNKKFGDILKKHGMVKSIDGELMVKQLKG